MGRQPVWIMIALVLDAVISVTGILTGPVYNMTDLLAAGPLLASARCNGRTTALIAGYALALCAIVAAGTGTTPLAFRGFRFSTVASAGVFGIFSPTSPSRRANAPM